jgi:hypothetical protein
LSLEFERILNVVIKVVEEIQLPKY